MRQEKFKLKDPSHEGYFNAKVEETEKVLEEGWFSSGDIGLMEEDGYFKIVDRKKRHDIGFRLNVFPMKSRRGGNIV